MCNYDNLATARGPAHLKIIHLRLHKPPLPLSFLLSTLISPPIKFFKLSSYFESHNIQLYQHKTTKFHNHEICPFAAVPLMGGSGRTEAGRCWINCGNGRPRLISIHCGLIFLPISPAADNGSYTHRIKT